MSTVCQATCATGLSQARAETAALASISTTRSARRCSKPSRVLPEYGLTRADARLLRRLAPAHWRAVCRRRRSVAELGSGSGMKTRWILEALARAGRVTYYPIDVSASALARVRAGTGGRSADVRPIEDTYLNGLRQAVCERRPRRAAAGAVSGQHDRQLRARPGRAGVSARHSRAACMPGDALLLGTDLIKAAGAHAAAPMTIPRASPRLST